MYRIKFKYMDLYIEWFNNANNDLSIKLTDKEEEAYIYPEYDLALSDVTEIGKLFINSIELQVSDGWNVTERF